MYFDVYINGERLGTFGHGDVQNVSVSVSGAADGFYLIASAVCREGEKQFYYFWLQEELSLNDEVRIVHAREGDVCEPQRKIELGRTERKAWEAGVCEFCQRTVSELERLIPGDANRPGICSECVQMCNEILRREA